jgi:hypothetical protein
VGATSNYDIDLVDASLNQLVKYLVTIKATSALLEPSMVPPSLWMFLMTLGSSLTQDSSPEY